VLACDPIRPLVIQLLHVNAPFDASLRFSKHLAEWQSRATDQMNATLIVRILQRMHEIWSAIYEA
jgi:hypothetical protein